MTGQQQPTVGVAIAEVASGAAVLVVLLPPLTASGITTFGIRFIAVAVLAMHLVGYFPATRSATELALLSAAAIWTVVHIDRGTDLRGAVVIGLLLWIAEEARDLSLTVRRPGRDIGSVVRKRLPRWFGIAAAALATDALVLLVLRQPPVHGWIWRLVGAAAVVALLATRRSTQLKGS